MNFQVHVLPSSGTSPLRRGSELDGVGGGRGVDDNPSIAVMAWERQVIAQRDTFWGDFGKLSERGGRLLSV